MIALYHEDYNKIISHIVNGLPNEACGLMAGRKEQAYRTVRKVYLLSNIDHSPEHFSMDPKEQLQAIADMRANGYELIGNFHSHPSTPARPSKEDIRLAFDPELSYMIISLQQKAPQLKCFRIINGAVSEETVVEHETSTV